MVKKVNPVPKGYRTVTPSLVVIDVSQAIDFYKHAFDAQLLSQIDDPTGSFAVQATIKIGNSIVMLQPETPALGILSPLSLGGSAGHLHLYVEQVESVWASALEAGATAISEPVDMYWGDRTAVLIDVFGYQWSLATRVEHVSKADIEKRRLALYSPAASDEAPLISANTDAIDPASTESSEIIADVFAQVHLETAESVAVVSA